MKHMFFQVTLYVPNEMTTMEAKDFIETALQAEPGHHAPEDPRSEVQTLQVLSHTGM